MDWSQLKKTDPVDDPRSTDEESETEGWDEFATDAGVGFADPNLAEAVNEHENGEDLPEFLGRRWREITDPSMQREAWIWLREWVDGFITDQRPQEGIIRSCWFQHPDAVSELWALANAEIKVWAEGMVSTMPLTGFQAYLPGTYERLRNSSMKNCHENEHKEPASYGRREAANALLVDEQAWVDHLGSIQDMERSMAPGYTRMAASNSNGEVAYSEPVQVLARAEAGPLRVSAPVVFRDGRGQEGLIAVATGPSLHRTWWEHSADGGSSWAELAKSVRDVSHQDDNEEGEDA